MDETASVTPVETTVPDEIKGWSWGGFLWTWIWAIGNNTWIGLLALIPLPFIGLIMAIVLGVNGREWAWKNKHWNSVEDFKKTQRNWVKWWFIIVVPLIILAFVGIFASAMLVALNPAAQIEKANQMRINQNSQQTIETVIEQ